MSDKCKQENKCSESHVPVFLIVIGAIIVNCLTLGLIVFLLWYSGGICHSYRNEVPEKNQIETYEIPDSTSSVKITEPEPAEKTIQNNEVRNVTKKPASTVRKSVVKKNDDNPDITQFITLNKEDEAKDLSLFTMADTVNYRIIGLLTVHTLHKGEFLTKLSLRYYGTKKLWPYIAKYNNISYTDTYMMPGEKIRIPQLVYDGKRADAGEQTVVKQQTVIQQPAVKEEPIVESNIAANNEDDNPSHEEKAIAEGNDFLNVLASDMSKAEIKQVIAEMEMESQEESTRNTIVNGADDIYAVSDQMPTYSGSYGELIHFFQDNIIYPPICKNNGIEGRVTVTFVVEKDGSITNARVVKGVHKEIDKEALRVVSNMPNWTPGRIDGEPVRVLQPISISFFLKKD